MPIDPLNCEKAEGLLEVLFMSKLGLTNVLLDKTFLLGNQGHCLREHWFVPNWGFTLFMSES